MAISNKQAWARAIAFCIGLHTLVGVLVGTPMNMGGGGLIEALWVSCAVALSNFLMLLFGRYGAISFLVSFIGGSFYIKFKYWTSFTIIPTSPDMYSADNITTTLFGLFLWFGIPIIVFGIVAIGERKTKV